MCAIFSDQTTVLSGQILRLLQEEFMIRFPAFPEIFGQLIPVPIPRTEYLPAAVPAETAPFPESASDKISEEMIQTAGSPSAENHGKFPRMEAALGTDGSHLYYEPSLLCAQFLQLPDRLKRAYLHVHVHCLCLHVFQARIRQEYPEKNLLENTDRNPFLSDRPPVPEKQNRQGPVKQRQISENGKLRNENTIPKYQKNLWDQACDLSAELMTGLLLGEDQNHCSNADLLLKPDHFKSDYLNASSLLPLLEASPALRELAAQCSCDTHQFWYEDVPDTESNLEQARASAENNSRREASAAGHRSSFLRMQEALEAKWLKQRRRLNTFLSNGAGQRNQEAGQNTEDAALQKRDEMDYRKFLHQFAVPREEPILDTDSFDYIPYCYGLTYYENMPFLEPLEYSEVNRLDELAIAIDTSGSCSGQIVRRFLEETWNILRQKENFFSRMRLHLIQCDSMIQDHQIFTSVEQWEEALPHLKIQGLGNTDFRPVFDYLNTLIRKKEIRRLRGLLYFTDGDGIYPRSRPPFDTAFVFLNRRLEKQKIPDWGIRLNLDLPETFDRYS